MPIRFLFLAVSLILLPSVFPVQAQVSITSTTTTYVQNFNGLRSTAGTSSTLPSGWRLLETGTNANSTYETDAGANTSGNTYSYGTGTSTERALGILRSSALVPLFGVQVRNRTGQTITSLNITYAGEQWRCGTAGRSDQLDFQYSLNATSLSTGTWVDANGLDFTSPYTITVGARDGNASGNRTVKSAIITGLSIPNNGIFWLRWSDLDANGADDGLAIDDFSLRVNAGDAIPPTATTFVPANGATGMARNGNLTVTFSEPVIKGSAGSIVVRRVSDLVAVQTTSVTSASVVLTSNTATLPYSGLAYGTGYFVTIDNGAFRDAAGNNFAGITGPGTWGFTTEAAPPPVVTVNPASLSFGYVAAGFTSPAQLVAFTTANLTTGLTVTAPASFEVSRDGTLFNTAVTYTLAEAQVGNTVHVRFAPASPNTSYSGDVQFTSTELSSSPLSVSGNSLTPPPASDTLNVVCWNVEWFGGSLGPADDDLQEQNVRTVMQNLNADVYGLGEIVSIPRLQNIVSQMPGYSLVVADFCSNGSTVSSCASAQKLAYVYRTSKVNPIRTYPMLKNGSANASYNWSSGRFPYQLEADVTLNGNTRRIQFFMVHAKANTSDFVVSYNRRKEGAREMRDSLNAQYGAGNWIVMGDYNDDLDRTITTQVAPDTTTSFISFKTDPQFYPVTLPLSLTGQRSTVSYPDVIDHVTVGSALHQNYVPQSARILRAEVEGWIPNYGTTTSDHYPVRTKYLWSGTTQQPVEWVRERPQAPDFRLRTVSVASRIDLYLSDKRAQPTRLYLMDMSGRVLAHTRVQTVEGTLMTSLYTGSIPAGIYIVRVVNGSGNLTQKVLIGR